MPERNIPPASDLFGKDGGGCRRLESVPRGKTPVLPIRYADLCRKSYWSRNVVQGTAPDFSEDMG